MEVLGSSMVVTFDLFPGVRLAAAWSGGPYVQVHSVDRGGFGIVVDAWYVWDDWLDAPAIPKTLDALEDFVRSRVDDPDAVCALVELAESVVSFHDARDPDEVAFASLN